MKSMLVTYKLDTSVKSILDFFNDRKIVFSDSFSISEAETIKENKELIFEISSDNLTDFYVAGMVGCFIEQQFRKPAITFDYSLSPDQSTEN